MFGCTCGDFACVLVLIAREAAGAAKHPAFPAPSFLIEGGFYKTRARRAAGMRSYTFHRHRGDRAL